MKQYTDQDTHQDDASLVARVRAGERQAFDILLERYTQSVLRVCAALLGDSVEAQDIVQEASLQAFLGLFRLREPARFAAWFHAIAVNLARSSFRHHRECSLYTLNDDDRIETLWIDAPQTLEEYQEERELQDEILLALQDLSPTNRQAVIGFYLQGLNYEELSQQLGVPVSTIKGRLFQGRKFLKDRLRSLADTRLASTHRQRKGKKMTTSDLIELQIHSVRMLLLTRQHIAVLRDPHTERGLAVPLSATEADALVAAFGARASKDEWPFLQDLPQHLLEALGAQLQHVLINALAGQAFYATLTLTQGGQTRETDMRLSESLALAVRTGAPLYITRSLFESAAMLDLTNQADPSSWKELEAKRNDVQNLGREERLQLEENVRSAMSPNRRIRGDAFWERVWGWLLESLAGAQESLSLAQLRSLDIASTFLPREVTWDEQSMIAIRLPNQISQARQQKGQEEMAWLLVRPEIWKRISEMLQRLQQPEGKSEEQTPAVTNPFPQDLPPEILQRVEERLAWLLEDTELRTAFVSNPQGTIVAWKGADTEDTVRSFGNKLFAEQSRIHTPLVNQGDLDRQLGDQPQLVIPPFGSKKVVRQDLPKEAGGIMGAGIHRSGWKMIVIFEGKNARDLKEETHSRLRQAVQEMENILSKN